MLVPYDSTISRIATIQAQLQALNGAFAPPSAPAMTPAPASSGNPTFQQALDQAQSSSPGALGATGAAPVTGSSVTLPAGATQQLTSDQQKFAVRLAQNTGLNVQVVSAWLLAEESGGAAQSRQSQSNNDWLNIGYTDSGTYGSSDQIWSDPVSAADATAGWLKGQDTIPGYGTASSGIQAILKTAGQPASAQIAAIQNSGWASGGYPDLPALYNQVA